MPRRRGPEAELAVNKARESQWRYLLRNPAFRNDINELLDTYDLIQEALQKQFVAGRQTVPQVEVRTGAPDGGGLRGPYALPPLTDDQRRRSELQSKARKLEEKLTASTRPSVSLYRHGSCGGGVSSTGPLAGSLSLS
jgi:hypothetical protein